MDATGLELVAAAVRDRFGDDAVTGAHYAYEQATLEVAPAAVHDVLEYLRDGAEVFRASPRQADMIILSGRVSIKMAPILRRIYDQMLEPKWVIAMGVCSSSAGMFNIYAVVQGADKFMPVDVYIPGCPPRPEALMYGIIKLQNKIKGQPDLGWRERYGAEGTEEVA